ncbi:MAG: hypothetical protein GY865_06940 [candidate division Zixibacteria bacterium]|nr:hypothetical protein [candidate division Zixibacteria bacterium]
MKNLKILTLICLLGAILYFAISCDNTTGPDPQYDFPDPIDSVATEITLYVYSDIYDVFICGTEKTSLTNDFSPLVRILLDSVEMATEGEITIDIEEADPYTDPPKYFIYAEADGFYTELYYCNKGGSITVDLDAIPELENSITGVLFYAPANSRDEYYAGDTIVLTGPNKSLITMTDSQGRYGVGNLDLGTYILTDGYSLMPAFYIQQINNAVTDYMSALFYEPTLDRAPYIYLYPETQTDISVELGLVPGGEIVESEPPYNNGWNVNVTPDGTIDNNYEFLYYESLQPVPLDYRFGWVLDGTDLENELRNLLSNIGFIENEIDDFIEFWIHILGDADFYAVYPQDVESFVTLNITPQPDNILRTLLLIRPLSNKINIPSPPESDEFIRDGFTVAEWGVIWLDGI